MIQLKPYKLRLLLYLSYHLLTILFYHAFFFLVFLIIDTYFLIPAVFTQPFDPVVQLAKPIDTSTKEAKVDSKN